MHELAVTQSLLALAQRHAQQHHATRVTELHIVVGQLATVVDDSVQFYWDIISAGTLCEGARLCFERVPAQVVCHTCHLIFDLTRSFDICPRCHDQHLQVTGGTELQLASLNIETAEPEAALVQE